MTNINLILISTFLVTTLGCGNAIKDYVGTSPAPAPSAPTPPPGSTPLPSEGLIGTGKSITVSTGSGIAIGANVKSAHSVSIHQQVKQGNQVRATVSVSSAKFK